MQCKIHIYGLGVFAAWALLLMPFGYAQTTPDPAEDASSDAAEVSGSAEVEHNEENYRRFMELRDRDPRTSNLPINAYQPGSQKLDELPESSQKHLRNELRGVILDEGEWQEGDENKRYAYVPSEAAKNDRELQLQEAEAWDELVEKYQEREAQIHNNSVRSQAARKAANAASAAGNADYRESGDEAGSQPGADARGMGSRGQSGQSGQAGTSGQSTQTGDADRSAQAAQQSPSDSGKARSKDSYSPASDAAQQAEARNAGVSENALQFLTQSQSIGQPGSQQPARQTSPSGSQPPAQQSSQQDSLAATGQDQQQPSQPEQLSQSEQSAEALQPSASDAENEAAENMVAETAAQQSSVAPTQPPPVVALPAPAADEVSKAGATQNALEALSRGTAPAVPPSPPADTLSIEDLSNARGVAEEDPPDSD